MSGSFNNIHPGLSFEKAIEILDTPVEELDLSSDYYMAVSHLLNFPGKKTEEALLKIAKNNSDKQAIRLARRKSIEILGRLECPQVAPISKECLSSSDPYLVENAIWCLKKLKCDDADAHRTLINLLKQNSHNQRILIQSLADLNALNAVEAIQPFLLSSTASISTAAGAALCRLTGERHYVAALKPKLFAPNQMDRQMAIEDLADCRGIELMQAVLSSPVSPVFRIRYIQAVCPGGIIPGGCDVDVTALIDQVLMDSPFDLQLPPPPGIDSTTDALFEGLFSNDFARSYNCLRVLSEAKSDDLWPILRNLWEAKAFNDYGAHYFFILLIGSVRTWPTESKTELKNLLITAIENKRPQFSKSRPIALLALLSLSPEMLTTSFLMDCLASSTRAWTLHYAVLTIVDRADSETREGIVHYILESRANILSNPFVKIKFDQLQSKKAL